MWKLIVDVNDNFKINDENPLYVRLFIVNKNLTEKIGSFRLSLTRRKDIFTRKYSDWLKILSELGGIFSFMKLFASILVMIFVNPNDNLRIYDSFIKNNKLNEIDLKLSSEHINDYLKIKNQDTKFLELNLNNKRKCDKCHYLFCWLCHKCCNTGKYKVDFAISDYIEENLNIDKESLPSDMEIVRT